MTVRSSEEVFDAFQFLRKKSVEEFWVLGLRPDKSVIRRRCLFRGTVDACMVHARDIFRFGCRTNASHLILVHNHPGVSPYPSPQDIAHTKRLIEVGNLIEIPILDHMIVSQDSYFSFLDFGWIDFQANRSFFIAQRSDLSHPPQKA